MSKRDAAGGACGANTDGPFYAMSAGLARSVASSSLAAAASIELRADRWPVARFFNGAEDLFVGWLVHAVGAVRNITCVDLGASAMHDLHYGTYHHYSRACQRQFNRTDLYTGATSGRDHDQEMIGPASTVVHHVRSPAQWARASVLAARWSKWLDSRAGVEAAPSGVGAFRGCRVHAHMHVRLHACAHGRIATWSHSISSSNSTSVRGSGRVVG
jgi:hypothetical protein